MAFGRRCAWCAVGVTGLRRLRARYVARGARAGFREVLPRYPKGKQAGPGLPALDRRFGPVRNEKGGPLSYSAICGNYVDPPRWTRD